MRCAGLTTGQVLERINGKSISKVSSKGDFNDIRYLRTMLTQVRLGSHRHWNA